MIGHSHSADKTLPSTHIAYMYTHNTHTTLHNVECHMYNIMYTLHQATNKNFAMTAQFQFVLKKGKL